MGRKLKDVKEKMQKETTHIRSSLTLSLSQGNFPVYFLDKVLFKMAYVNVSSCSSRCGPHLRCEEADVWWEEQTEVAVCECRIPQRPKKLLAKKKLMNQCYFKAGGIVHALVFIVSAKKERQLCFHMVIDY